VRYVTVNGWGFDPPIPSVTDYGWGVSLNPSVSVIRRRIGPLGLVTSMNVECGQPMPCNKLERGNLLTYSDLFMVSPTYELIWLILTVREQQVVGSVVW
jgi:hypothetical protein